MAKDRLHTALGNSSETTATESRVPQINGNAVRLRQAIVSNKAPTSQMQNPFRFPAGLDAGPALFLFHHTLQRMLMLPCKIHHLGHLGLGDLIGENATLPDAVVVDV